MNKYVFLKHVCVFVLVYLVLFTNYYSHYLTRHSVTLFFNYCRISNRQQCVVYGGVCLWNSLQLDIRNYIIIIYYTLYIKNNRNSFI